MTGDRLTVLAPAKVNLYLAVGPRQADSYHALLTLFERLEWADELVLTARSSGITMASDDPALPTDARNLVVQAAQAFFDAADVAGGVAVRLVKRLPVAAGLGGGSSDAAATLLGLNALYGRPLDRPALRRIGGRLGADVPFFLSDAAVAWGRGRGDEVSPCDPPPAPVWHVLVNPGVPLLTKAVYEAFDRAGQASGLTGIPPDAMILQDSMRTGDVAGMAARLANALEPAIVACYPAIRDVKTVLSDSGALGVLVSGSGPTVFGLTADESHARDVQARVHRARPAWTVVTARTALVPLAAGPVRGDSSSALSSNGRTPDFGSGYPGSSPGGATLRVI